MDRIEITPIGLYESISKEKYQLPVQAGLDTCPNGIIHLKKYSNFEQGLDNLDGFSHLWILYSFHLAKQWKPKVLPPRSSSKKGIFSTRSPHRPNHIGMSCVKLIHIDGLNIYIEATDLLDKTPILDIKPYLNYCDSVPEASTGWLEENQPHSFTLTLTESVKQQLNWLEEKQVNLQELFESTLTYYPKPDKRKRTEKLKSIDEKNDLCQLRVKTWKVIYTLNEDLSQIEVIKIESAYENAYLQNEKKSNWDDVPLHNAFIKKFS